MNPLPWLILFLPLLASAVITLFLQRKPYLSAVCSVGAIVISFLLSAVMLAQLISLGSVPDVSLSWLQVGNLNIEFGMHLDELSLLMLLIVTGVGSCIHFYSIGYMHDDPGYARYFACMSLFTFSMLGIVISNNFFQMFVFWELVGVSSYSLVGFWFERPAAADAAKKAFLTNRLGDFGFMVGIVLVWATAGTLNFEGIHQQMVRDPDLFGATATIAGLLIFCGAVGKSAQFPLHVWLPDAMEGPTPVSALIHAATMVAAGVYMLCRTSFFYTAPDLHVISWIGGITALMAAAIAVQQDDIKRILAYSTLSQLGYMVMAVGFAEPGAAMFHLTTHAFFKALLFLGAGAVIHSMHHEQNIWKMGKLRRKIPLTYRCFLVGTLALCGVPPFSGFYSKDAILAAAWKHSPTLFAFGLLAAFLTTFYMFRLIIVVFLAKDDEEHKHPKRSRVIAYPMVVLAIAAFVGGFMGIRQFIAPQFPMASELPAGSPISTFLSLALEPFLASPVPAFLGLGAFVLGCVLAFAIYKDARTDPLQAKLPDVSSILQNKFYFDEFYAEVVALFHDAPAKFANFVDLFIKIMVRLVHALVEWTGRVLRLAQNGNLQTYTLLMAAGAALALYFLLSH